MSSFRSLKARFPSVAYVTGADIEFLKSCHISPGPGGDNVASRDTGEIVLSKELCLLFKAIREAAGKPITINAGFRTEAYQKKLEAQGYKTAKVSPHCFGVAFDLSIPQGYTAESFAKLITKVAKGQVRIGWKAYGGTFVHIDIGFILKPNPVPAAYKPGVIW